MIKSSEEKQLFKKKHRARKLALQALYQWHMAASPLAEIEAQFVAINNMEKVDTAYFHRLLHDIPARLSSIDDALTPCLDRPIEQLNPVELAVLRLSTYEFLYCYEVPSLVILDESVLLSKAFGSQEGYKYVNGVLNQIGRTHRPFDFNE